LLGRPLRACRGRRPRRVRALLAHGGESAVAFRQSNALGTRNVIGFVAAWPTAHALACLRINAPVAGIAARLATGPGGLTPDRAGFAPAGQQTGFHEVSASLIPPRPAWPGRNWSSYPQDDLQNSAPGGAGGALPAWRAQTRGQAAHGPPERVQASEPGIQAPLAGIHPCRPSLEARAGSLAGDPAPKANRKGIQRAGDARR